MLLELEGSGLTSSSVPLLPSNKTKEPQRTLTDDPEHPPTTLNNNSSTQNDLHNNHIQPLKPEVLLDRNTSPDPKVTSTSNRDSLEGDPVKMADKRRYFEREGGREREGSYGRGSSFGGRGGGDGRSEEGYDEPPNCRLFILCGRNVGEDELRGSFEKFGGIKELWIVKDKGNGESKGVAYITFSKTSEAAVAMEEMNGKFIGNNAKSLKVLIANSRDQGSRREVNEEERLLRLFIIVPKSMSESDLKDHFAQFGDVERCNIVRDRNTKESKGYAYVTFHRISHAAKAFEGCDRSFKPRFADPRPQKSHGEDRYSSAHGSTTGGYDVHDYPVVEPQYPQMLNHHHHDQHAHHSLQHGSSHHSSPTASALITIIAHGSLNQDQLWRLSDFFPGLDYCNVRHDPKTRQCYASVVYNSSQAAAYAKEKLHGFEYPPGHRLIVKLETHSERTSGSLLGPPVRGGYGLSHNGNSGVQTGQLVSSSGSRSAAGLSPDLASVLTETIAQAQSILQASGLNSSHSHQSHHMSSHQNPPLGVGESYDPSYCSVKLPAPQPLAPMDSTVLERLFVVCHPSPPPLYALKDTFGRFGNLIDIFMLNGKNFGYAKYANKHSADEARGTLHGQEICGMRLKVFQAEPQDQQKGGMLGPPANNSDQKCKRLRIADDLE